GLVLVFRAGRGGWVAVVGEPGGPRLDRRPRRRRGVGAQRARERRAVEAARLRAARAAAARRGRGGRRAYLPGPDAGGRRRVLEELGERPGRVAPHRAAR